MPPCGTADLLCRTSPSFTIEKSLLTHGRAEITQRSFKGVTKPSSAAFTRGIPQIGRQTDSQAPARFRRLQTVFYQVNFLKQRKMRMEYQRSEAMQHPCLSRHPSRDEVGGCCPSIPYCESWRSEHRAASPLPVAACLSSGAVAGYYWDQIKSCDRVQKSILPLIICLGGLMSSISKIRLRAAECAVPYSWEALACDLSSSHTGSRLYCVVSQYR